MAREMLAVPLGAGGGWTDSRRWLPGRVELTNSRLCHPSPVAVRGPVIAAVKALGVEKVCQRKLHERELWSAKKDGIGVKEEAKRSLPIRLVTVRKTLDMGVQSVVGDYVSKVKRYCTFEELQVRPNPKSTSDVNAQVEAEGERVLKAIAPRDWVVLVDERGRDITSEQLATLIADAGDTGSSALVFCIGGPYGHGSQVRQRANVAIKLSSMVLNHQVATIVLLEQIYRAWTILRGEKYHH